MKVYLYLNLYILFIYNFFKKLIEKDKFKIEEKDGFYTLTFCYEEKNGR